MTARVMKVGTRYPSRSEVTAAHHRRMVCWACEPDHEVSITASADWDGGFATDPKEYGLLCSTYYLEAPDLGSYEVFWAWLSRNHSAPDQAHPTMASLMDELNLLPAEEREQVLTYSVGMWLLIASRRSPDQPAYREDCATRTFGEVMEEALGLVVGWSHKGSLAHRMEHPHEVLAEDELQRYEARYVRRTSPTGQSGTA